MTVLLTLTIAGTDTGPFDLFSDADGYVTAFELGVSKASLVSGYSSSVVPNLATIVRVKSVGICTTHVDIVLVNPTTTTTTTAPPVFQHDFGDTGNSNPSTACGLFSDDQPKYSLDSVLSINTLLYNDPGLTTLWDGGGISWHNGGLPGNTYVVGTGVNKGKIISVHVCV